MSEIVFNRKNYHIKDNSLIFFEKGDESTKPIICRAYYLDEGNEKSIVFETEYFYLKKGIQKSERGTYFIDITLNEKNNALLEFIGEMDEIAMGTTYENSIKWWNKQMSKTTIDEFYKFPLRTSKEYKEPFIRLRLDTNVLVHTQDGLIIDIDTISENSKVKIKVQYEGIIFLAKNFEPVYTVKNIKYSYPKVEDTESFYVEEKNDNGFFKENEQVDSEPEILPEAFAEFEDNNESDVRSLLKMEDVSVENENDEEVESNEVLEDEKDLGDFLNKNVGEIKSNIPDEPEEVHEILSKTLTKAINLSSIPLDEPTESLVIYDDDPEEELEKKLRKLTDRITQRKNERSNASSINEGTSKSKKTTIVRYSKTRTINRPSVI